jgi:hypothetical protein
VLHEASLSRVHADHCGSQHSHSCHSRLALSSPQTRAIALPQQIAYALGPHLLHLMKLLMAAAALAHIIACFFFVS